MSGQALIFFVLFALTLVGTYLGVRRGWAPTRAIAALGAVLSILTMVLFSLGQENTLLQALIVGVLLGGVFTAATVAVATFFRNAERQPRPKPPLQPPPDLPEDAP